MALSIEAALELEVFSRCSVHVYAGQENLGRAVRWVHSTEIPDIAKFLTGGEMLLTAGLGIGSTAGVQRRFIQEVSAAGAAAVVIELSGRAFHHMPSALEAEAQSLHLPLIGLDGEVPFVEVSAQVHELLADQVNSELLAFERLNADFIRLLLDGRSHVSLTEALARQVGCPVVLEDSRHQPVAYSRGTPETDELMKNWRLHARVAHQATNVGVLSPQPDEADDAVADQVAVQAAGEIGGTAQTCTRRRIVLRGESWGWLHVFHGSHVLDRASTYAIDRAADAIAITLISDRESGARASHRQSSLINRLLRGDITGDQFVERVLRVGRDLRGRPLVVVMVDKADGTSVDEGALGSQLTQLQLQAVTADIGDHLMAVVGLSKRMSAQDLTDHLNPLGWRVGVSRAGRANNLSDAIRQARAAASVAAAQDRPAAQHFDRLGVMRLLVALSNGPELGRYVQDELGTLLAHDAKESNPLLPTLRAYLEQDGNKSRAAELLFVQRRTLYYRLDRINSLLDRSLEDPEARAALSLALRALDFLKSGDPGEGH